MVSERRTAGITFLEIDVQMLAFGNVDGAAMVMAMVSCGISRETSSTPCVGPMTDGGRWVVLVSYARSGRHGGFRWRKIRSREVVVARQELGEPRI